MWTIWVSLHRGLFYALFCVLVWGFAHYWYLRTDLKKYLRRRKGHTWSVDMEAKTGTGSLTNANH